MASLVSYFSSMEDPRVARTRRHNFIDIIAMTISAVICGCDDWYEIELFARTKEAWFRGFLELPNGIPSHDTFNRVFAAINPKALQDCFSHWIQDIATLSEGRIISIDGKRLCQSGQDGKRSVIHMVSAWCSHNSMVLAQIKTDDKSNEITAIPELLKKLDIAGCTVTIDAIGCQSAIATQVVAAKADYLLAVKGNQERLLDDMKEAFATTPATEMSAHTTLEQGHGRIEKRTCSVITDTDWVCNRKDWPGLKTLVRVCSERTDKASDVKSVEERYYISSRDAGAEALLAATRQHWAIENNLHWMLDVHFGEDASTKRAGNAAQNFALITRIALNLLKNDKSKKTAIKNKRLLAGWDHTFLERILFGNN